MLIIQFTIEIDQQEKEIINVELNFQVKTIIIDYNFNKHSAARMKTQYN